MSCHVNTDMLNTELVLPTDNSGTNPVVGKILSKIYKANNCIRQTLNKTTKDSSVALESKVKRQNQVRG